ncbi:MAG TPA: amidohydrolase family protein [Burkholderiales bacterium]|nr:amidohydrolase family protein [Burkholderiales bacterium]
MQTLDRQHRAPREPLPPQATDSHMHVFGPFERFPLASERAYNVAEAPLGTHERMKAQTGLERTVLVQASGHGTDNRAMLAALAELGPRGRGVAVVAPQTPLADLQRMHKAGVRGVRLNLYTFPGRHVGEPAALVRTYERLIAPLGWHLQLFCEPATLSALAQSIERCSVPVVVDHMGMADAALGLDQPAFQALLRLASTGRTWVKVAGADRITRGTGRLADAIPFMRALVEAAPRQLVWGTDWPNIGFHARQPVQGDELLAHRELDAGELLDVFAEAVPDAEARRAILVENPERLYGFSASS